MPLLKTWESLNNMYTTPKGLRRDNMSEYNTWFGMKSRCYNKNAHNYKYYGGKGVKVCGWWINSFENFLNDMGKRPSPKHSIDRKDNDGNYEPDNCRWATRYQQSNNQSHTRFFKYKGKKHTVSNIAGITGLNRLTVNSRLSRGWSIQKILNTPVGNTNKIDPNDIQKIILMSNKGYSANTITPYFKYCRKTINKIINRNKLNQHGK